MKPWMETGQHRQFRYRNPFRALASCQGLFVCAEMERGDRDTAGALLVVSHLGKGMGKQKEL